MVFLGASRWPPAGIIRYGAFMKRFLLLSVALLGVGAVISASHVNATVSPARHDYRLDVHGTPGVRVHMLLITKATDNANPDRRDEIITLPAKIDFKAARCYAWLDTLPNGASGNEGDVCDVDLFIDGHRSSACEGTIRKQNRQTDGVGDL
jgi:hypothetical protein